MDSLTTTPVAVGILTSLVATLVWYLVLGPLIERGRKQTQDLRLRYYRRDLDETHADIDHGAVNYPRLVRRCLLAFFVAQCGLVALALSFVILPTTLPRWQGTVIGALSSFVCIASQAYIFRITRGAMNAYEAIYSYRQWRTILAPHVPPETLQKWDAKMTSTDGGQMSSVFTDMQSTRDRLPDHQRPRLTKLPPLIP